MSQKKTVLVATVGTRDLSFQLSKDNWSNVGDSMARFGDRPTPAQEVYESIATEPGVLGEPGDCFRQRTSFLLENWERFGDRIKPVMLGGVIEQNAVCLEKVYLVATDQVQAIKRFQDSDTCYAAAIIARWIETYHQIPCQIILLGNGGENPTDFDAMVQWSKQSVWAVVREAIGFAVTARVASQPKKQVIERILLSPKGGVGQCSEALRVTALTGFVEQELQFCDFVEDVDGNRRGQFSRHHFSSGTHYLWELNQRQAIALLERYDYAGVQSILRGYWKVSSDPDILKVKDLLEIMEQWNTADFREFGDLLQQFATRHSLNWDLSILNNWWWSAYESAYLGVIRFQQGNTVEAFFHSFRSVEGLICEWAISTYSDHIELTPRAPRLKRSIDSKLPGFYSRNSTQGNEIYLFGNSLDNLLRQARPDIVKHVDLQKFFDHVRKQRNHVFHELRGVTKKKVSEAWGTENKAQWQSRVLGCLNCVSEQSFDSLESASLMPQIHEELKQLISTYQP
jgi:hypothetical protein